MLCSLGTKQSPSRALAVLSIIRSLSTLPSSAQHTSDAPDADLAITPVTSAVSSAKFPSTEYRLVIGLEIHAQILAQSKIFSGAAVAFASQPNSCVAFVDAAYPGTLPVLNARCVEAAVQTGCALNATIHRVSLFDRKHYFYSDLPAGYQITQQRMPIATQGYLDVEVSASAGKNLKNINAALRASLDMRTRRVRIARVQLEQDSGKQDTRRAPDGTETALLDLNRAGAGLMEIVTLPDLTCAQEATEFVRKLQALLRRIGTCDGNMAEGSLRVDANVSVDKFQRDSADWRLVLRGPRVEVKNVSGLRFLGKAIQYEAGVQIQSFESGLSVARETKRYDAAAGKTFSMRTKEEEKDYRYMPDPDLPPLVLAQEYIDAARSSLPELPDATIQRLVRQYGLGVADATTLVDEAGGAAYFEAVIDEAQRRLPGVQLTSGAHSDGLAEKSLAQRVCSWICTNIFSVAHSRSQTMEQPPVSASQLAELAALFQSKALNSNTARVVLHELCTPGDEARSARDVAVSKGFLSATDAALKPPDSVLSANAGQLPGSGHHSALEQTCRAVVAAHPEQVARFQSGKERLLTFFVGKVLSQTKGTADPQEATAILRRLLAKQ